VTARTAQRFLGGLAEIRGSNAALAVVGEHRGPFDHATGGRCGRPRAGCLAVPATSDTNGLCRPA
jgi:hypothetical protein